MSTLTAPRFTSDEWARMLAEPIKDERYLETPLGPEIEAFLSYFKTERGRMDGTVQTFRYVLARLALFHQVPLETFEPPEGTRMLRAFMRHFYGDVAANTWNSKLAGVKSFYRWAVEEDRLVADPAAKIRNRKVPGTDRRAHPESLILRIVSAQPERRDRIAIQLMARLALRRNELRQVQFRHMNLDTNELTVFGKGGTVLPVAVHPDLVEQWLRHALERSAQPDEFLLYPFKIGRIGFGPDARRGVIWEDRHAALALSSVDKWWQRCLARAGVPQFPMHELRHSAGTNYYRATRDLKLTQLLMRHADPKTTAGTYLHLDQRDLAESYHGLPAWGVED